MKFAQKNERSLSEVLSEVLSKKEFEKLQEIIVYIEKNGEISPKMAEEICKKAPATIRRYMHKLVNTGFIEAQGKTNNLIYKRSKTL